MNKVFIVLALGLLLASPFIAAEFEMREIRILSPFEAFLSDIGLLAIGFDSGWYQPGERVSMVIQTAVPCDFEYAYVNIEYEDGFQRIYQQDVTGLFNPCTSSYVELSFDAPSSSGQYRAEVMFVDSSGYDVWVDSAYFLVSSTNPECPSDYCSSWTWVEGVPNGDLYRRDCHDYDSVTCQDTPSEQSRTTCDSGYELVNGNCLLISGEAECGNNVVEAGEECDRGSSNMICQASDTICTNNCKLFDCGDVPGFDDGQEQEQPGVSEGSKFNMGALWGLLIVLIGFGLVITGVVINRD